MRDRAGIAQLVEQRFCKPLVVGSIPTAGTKSSSEAFRWAASANYLPRLILANGLAQGCALRDLSRATRELYSERALVRVQVGTYPNRTPRYGPRVAEAVPTAQ